MERLFCFFGLVCIIFFLPQEGNLVETKTATTLSKTATTLPGNVSTVLYHYWFEYGAYIYGQNGTPQTPRLRQRLPETLTLTHSRLVAPPAPCPLSAVA